MSGSNRAEGDFTLKQPVYKSFTELQEGERLPKESRPFRNTQAELSKAAEKFY